MSWVHQVGREHVIVGAAAAQAADAAEAAGTEAAGPQIGRAGQGWSPGPLVGNGGDVVRAEERGEVAASAGRKGLAAAHAEEIARDAPARQVELLGAEAVVLVQVIAQQFLLAGEGGSAHPYSTGPACWPGPRGRPST